MNDFRRNCPQCNETLTYSTEGNLETAARNNSLCSKCAHREIERWNAGKTKETDPKVLALSKTLKASMNNTVLRKRLDEKKKLSKEQILKRIEDAKSTWELLDRSLSNYTRLIDRNLLFQCKVCAHQELKSVGDIIARCRCKKCNPVKGKGSNNPAFVPLESFLSQLAAKHGLEKFKFDPSTYSGKYAKMEWECSICSSRFSKAPRVLLQENVGCPSCFRNVTTQKQPRSEKEFVETSARIHGDKFTYYQSENQKWNNSTLVKRKCNDCATEVTQNPVSHLKNGCSICSQKFKHDSRSFIVKSMKIWGPDAFDYSNVFYQGNKEHVDLKCKKCEHEFKVTPANHWTRGCPKCAKKRFVSIGETEWLNSLGIPDAQRQYFVTLPGGEVYNCDAVVGMKIYEYYGDFWHGNPKRFPPELINVKTGTTMSELYQATLDREELLKQEGYEVITMWESDWIEMRKK